MNVRQLRRVKMFLQFKEEILNDGKDYFKSKISERNNENKEKLKQTTLEKTRTNIFEYPEDKKKYKMGIGENFDLLKFSHYFDWVSPHFLKCEIRKISL